MINILLKWFTRNTKKNYNYLKIYLNLFILYLINPIFDNDYKIIFPINLLNKYNNKILYLRIFNLIVNLKIHIYILLNTLTMQDILIIPSDI